MWPLVGLPIFDNELMPSLLSISSVDVSSDSEIGLPPSPLAAALMDLDDSIEAATLLLRFWFFEAHLMYHSAVLERFGS